MEAGVDGGPLRGQDHRPGPPLLLLREPRLEGRAQYNAIFQWEIWGTLPLLGPYHIAFHDHGYSL